MDQAFETFSRRIKLASFFHKPTNEFEEVTTRKLFIEKSEWIPPDMFMCGNTLRFLHKLETDLGKIKIKQKRH